MKAMNDILEGKSSKKGNPVKALLIALGGVILIMLGYFYLSGEPTLSAVQQTITVRPIHRSDLEIKVATYGQLESKFERVVSTPMEAQVGRILKYPGEFVEKGEVIMVLNNEQIKRDLIDSELELGSLKAELNRILIEGERAHINNRTELEKLKSQQFETNVREKASAALAESGIIPSIELSITQAKQAGLEKLVMLYQQKLSKEQDFYERDANIQKDIIDQAKRKRDLLLEKQRALNVVAHIPGVIQSIPVKEGQRLANGEQVAKIASLRPLIAKLKVNQNDASNVKVGLKVELNSLGQSGLHGVVTRIYPVVENGVVTVEADLVGPLSSHEKPSMTVEGNILVDEMKQVLYIQKPSNIEKNMVGRLFKFDREAGVGTRTQLQFGKVSGKFIVIESGAAEGDEFIISDTRKLEQFKKIEVVL